ncbi:purine-nucleoside phosphorylase [Lacrimispora sp.]|uniref:purine-nucleoside phosphorylase n=1 Tax=Lacrimispora sp. TaxID=2719234 RepID=UPI003990E7CE
MNQVYEKLQNCLKSVREKTDFIPEVALILGSGLGEYAEEIEVTTAIDYKDIEGFPVSTVAGHKGRFIFGYVNKVPVVIMQGRVHYYEGYPMTDVVLPTRLMGLLGAKTLFLTNASGGVNKEYRPGDFMLLKDHIASFVPSPLIGENIEELGPRFPDMSDIYRKELRAVIKEAAKEEGVDLREGVYMQLSGPAYESPSEVQMCRILGADAVGMSTACEALAANHMGMKVCGISCITNMACGITDQPLSHAEVQETADRVAPLFKKLITASITKLAER